MFGLEEHEQSWTTGKFDQNHKNDNNNDHRKFMWNWYIYIYNYIYNDKGKTVVINSRLHMHIFYTQNQLINVLSRNYLCWNYPVPNVPISRYEDYSWRPLWLPSRPRLFSCKKTAGPELFSSIYLLNGGNRLSTSGRRTSAPREVSEFCAKLWKCRLESPIGWEAHPTMESQNWSDGV